MLNEPKMLVWNVQGLNNRPQCTGVQSLVSTAGVSIVCLHETMAIEAPSQVMEAQQLFLLASY